MKTPVILQALGRRSFGPHLYSFYDTNGLGPILGVSAPTRTQIPKQVNVWPHVIIRKTSAASLVHWMPHLKWQTLNGLHGSRWSIFDKLFCYHLGNKFNPLV